MNLLGALIGKNVTIGLRRTARVKIGKIRLKQPRKCETYATDIFGSLRSGIIPGMGFCIWSYWDGRIIYIDPDEMP